MPAPTLSQLMPTTSDDSDAIQYYLQYCDKYGYYYLGGQHKMSLDTPITMEIIEKVKQANSNSMQYMTNSFEMASIYAHDKRFNCIVKMVTQML